MTATARVIAPAVSPATSLQHQLTTRPTFCNIPVAKQTAQNAALHLHQLRHSLFKITTTLSDTKKNEVACFATYWLTTVSCHH